jgi:hypothetical protein
MTGRYEEAWESIKTEWSIISVRSRLLIKTLMNWDMYRGITIKAAEALEISSETNYINPWMFAYVYAFGRQ